MALLVNLDLHLCESIGTFTILFKASGSLALFPFYKAGLSGELINKLRASFIGGAASKLKAPSMSGHQNFYCNFFSTENVLLTTVDVSLGVFRKLTTSKLIP